MSMNHQLYHPLVCSLIPRKLRPNMDDAIDALGDLYNPPTAQPFRFHFENDTILKHAYFYRYFVCISNAVKVCWKKFAKTGLLGFLKNKANINVLCIGGSSGCDLVGFCQFLDKYCHIDPKVNAVILDYYDWSKETRELIANVDGSENFGIVDFEYVPFNFFEWPIKDGILNQLLRADVITVVKLLSAVGTEKNRFAKNDLADLLSNMEIDSYVFFLDNSEGPYKRTMDKVAADNRLHLICEVVDEEISIPGEESDQMAHSRFRTLPLKSISVSASLWKCDHDEE